MSVIVYIEDLGLHSNGKYNNLPLETEYIIIGCLLDGIDEGILNNLPTGLKKIIIIDYEKTITYWSGFKDLTEYLEHITGGKIPFNCKVETITDEKFGYSEEVMFFCAIGDLEDDGERLFKLNRLVKKGIYDVLYYDYNGNQTEKKDFFSFRGKSVYISIGVF